MSVLKDIHSLMNPEDIKAARKEYQEETAHLRAAKEALSQSLAEGVRAGMEARNISQNQLRQELHMSSATMTEIVNGRGNPTLETISRFALMLDMVPRIVWEKKQG